MEALTRLVSESFARHGFDRPIDYRRLKWSRWFRCESHHSLLLVPSKPGIFALAEGVGNSSTSPGTAALGCPAERNSADTSWNRVGRDFSRAVEPTPYDSASAAEGRMLAVTQFFEAEDMAFILDRMLSRYNPMRGRLESGRYFVRFVVIEDESQRHNIYGALNQWIRSSSEKNTGMGSHYARSAEPSATEQVAARDDSQANLFSSAEMGRVIFSAHVATATSALPRALGEAKGSTSTLADDTKQPSASVPAPRPSGADLKIQSPPAFPSGF